MIGFAAPWILTALILLPGIYWLLRITPPSPRLVRFPAIRLLRDLVQREETPARTPLWLILFRLFLAALLIVALSGPVLQPSAMPPGRGPEIIVVDTGWAAAESWSAIKEALLAEIDRDQRAGMTVVLLPTARAAANNPIDAIGPLPANEAKRIAEALEPVPWATERGAAAKILRRFDARSGALWLSDGIAGDGGDLLARALASFTGPRVRTPISASLPRLLLPPEPAPDLVLTVRRAEGTGSFPVTLIAHGEDGRVLGEATGSFASGERAANVRFDLPNELRNRIARIDIAGSHNAGGTVLLDERWRRRPVAIATAAEGNDSSELLNGSFYLEQALKPFADVSTGDLSSLLKGQFAILILTDSVPISPVEKRDLADWVEKGGLLLRFAGPKLAGADPAANDPLLPVQLRTGARSLSGAMSWTEPARLSPFPETSPFAGLDIPKDVTVSRQILAEPALDLDSKVWASLSDGTPLITEDKREAGAVILVHTTADPSWSNLALSGLFPEMLRRIVAYSTGISGAPKHGVLEPYRLLDGFAKLQAPGGTAMAIAADRLAGFMPDPQHPPGYYGETDARTALNLTQNLTSIAPIGDLPAALTREDYSAQGEFSLTPSLLGLLLALAAFDTILALWLGGSLPHLPRRRPAARAGIIVFALCAVVGTSLAQTSSGDGVDPKVALAASQVTLGYVATGDASADRISFAGLNGLAHQLILRTSIDHVAPAEVNLEKDELSVYPLLYWPISAMAKPLSDEAKSRLNSYLSNGGMILIDTRAGQGGAGQGGGGSSNVGPDLAKLIQGIDVPTLAPMPAGHVLTKSFYLLDQFPGRAVGGNVWVERDQDAPNDGVSPVIVGSADWAGAWAVDNAGSPLFTLSPGGERQREWAYRFGVNLVMYALTGNYKADLVHTPFILQRLGQ
jgi:hypothetical protein